MTKSILVGLLFISIYCGYAQQQIVVTVSPTTNVSINGHLDLDRTKYFNLSSAADQISRIKDTAIEDYLFKDLGATMGRQLSMVKSERDWSNAVREDANRPGYLDIDYYVSRKNPNDAGLDAYKTLWGDRQGLATHDSHDAYPDFMEQWGVDESDKFPVNTDASAEMVAYMLKHRYTDFQRPTYFELVNEPHWKVWSDQRFVDFHTKAKAKVLELGVDTRVGGPCYSVSYFYRNEYTGTKNLIKFIDDTQFGLDFYSFHSYDYMKWDDSAQDFVGSITSGLPFEGVFDALAAYTYNKYGRELNYVCSEHGAYISDSGNRDDALNMLGEKYFPGSGFDYEMEKRTIDNFVMVNGAIANTLTFMNHPHIVQKSVPFILLESAGWDTRYYSSLLVKKDFNKQSTTWVQSRLIDYYKFFDGVKGRRVEAHTADTDIQQLSFVDGSSLIVLLHNQSNVAGEIDVKIAGFDQALDHIKIRRLSRAVDFRPVFEEKTITSLNDLSIGAQESIALFVTYKEDIPATVELDEIAHYSAQSSVQFSGSKVFQVNIPDHKRAQYGLVRVGVNRKADFSREVSIKLNGHVLAVPVEESATRITQNAQDYSTTKIVKVPGDWLKAENEVEVSFPDGKSGGVGAIVIRAAIGAEEREESVLDTKKGGFGFNIYPNPAQRMLHFTADQTGQVQIMDLSGKRVWSGDVTAGSNTLDIATLQTGNYVLQLILPGSVHTNKLVIR